MTDTLRYPFTADTRLGQSEQYQVIQILPSRPFPAIPDPAVTTDVFRMGGGDDDGGGAGLYCDIRPLRTIALGGPPTVTFAFHQVVNKFDYKVSAFTQVTLEFVSDTAQIIGNGTTDLIGLYGEILPADLGDPVAPMTANRRLLLGILGVSLGPGLLPQIPIVLQPPPSNVTVGFTCMSCNVSLFSGLSIGGVTADIACTNVRVIARAVHNGQFPG